MTDQTIAPTARRILGTINSRAARNAEEEIDTLEANLRGAIATILIMQREAADGPD